MPLPADDWTGTDAKPNELREAADRALYAVMKAERSPHAVVKVGQNDMAELALVSST
jgi:hypothetical protein